MLEGKSTDESTKEAERNIFLTIVVTATFFVLVVIEVICLCTVIGTRDFSDFDARYKVSRIGSDI